MCPAGALTATSPIASRIKSLTRRSPAAPSYCKYPTYIGNAIDAFEESGGSIREAFYRGNDISSYSSEREEVDELIQEVEDQYVNLVIIEDNRPKSCVIKDTESDISFRVTYSGNTMYVEEL